MPVVIAYTHVQAFDRRGLAIKMYAVHDRRGLTVLVNMKFISEKNDKEMKKRFSKGYIAFAIISWILFLGVLGAIIYLSLQNGEAAKATGKSYIYSLAQWYYGVEDVPEIVMVSFTYKFRQIGRIGIFFGLGILGTNVVFVTFPKLLWILRSMISAAMLLGVAVFTERIKIYLPSRHFSEQEMMYSIFGAMLGFVFIAVVYFVYIHIMWFIKRSS